MIVSEEFKNILLKGMKLPKIDAIRDTLKVIDLSKLRDILYQGISKAREDKVFDNGTIGGYVVAAIDGTQTFNSDKKSCENCLIAFKKGKQEKRNFHSSVVLSTIGEGAKLIIDFEQYKPGEDTATKDEGELTAAKRLITRASENHKHLIDVLVYDAIACNSEWINACISSDIEAVLCLMFIASNYVQLFYHRRIKRSVKTQVELVRQLIKGLYTLKRKPELIFNTG
jgi:hypothetical protein